MFGRRKDNLFNLRPATLVFFCFACGVAFARGTEDGVSITVSAFSLLLPLVLPIFSRRKKTALVWGVFACAFFFLGILVYFSSLPSLPALPSGESVITGTVTEKSLGEGSARYVLNNLIANGVSLKGKAIFFSQEEFSLGSELSITAQISALKQTDYRLAEGIFYSLNQIGSVKRVGEVFSFVFSLRERIISVLFSAMPKEEASVFYALVTGDSSAMEEGLLTSVRQGGVAHLFAVSGLHIGVVYAGVNALLKRTPISKIFRSIFAIVILFCYVALCGYTASALRAFLMCTIYEVCFYLKLRRDSMEITSLAGFFLLVANPNNLFTAGYLLSFASAFSFSVLCLPIQALFQRIGVKSKVFSSLFVGLSASIFTLPVSLELFGSFSLLAVPLGAILVPVVSVLFPPFLLLLLLSAAFPFAAEVLLFLPELFFHGLCFLFRYSSFSWFTLRGLKFSAAMLPYYLSLLFFGGKVNLRPALRNLLGGVLLVSALLFALGA